MFQQQDLTEGACGARTRAGTPCKRRDIYDSGRCKFHGGMSAGAKTPEGKMRSIAALRAGWVKWRAKVIKKISTP